MAFVLPSSTSVSGSGAADDRPSAHRPPSRRSCSASDISIRLLRPSRVGIKPFILVFIEIDDLHAFHFVKSRTECGSAILARPFVIAPGLPSCQSFDEGPFVPVQWPCPPLRLSTWSWHDHLRYSGMAGRSAGTSSKDEIRTPRLRRDPRSWDSGCGQGGPPLGVRAFLWILGWWKDFQRTISRFPDDCRGALPFPSLLHDRGFGSFDPHPRRRWERPSA